MSEDKDLKSKLREIFDVSVSVDVLNVAQNVMDENVDLKRRVKAHEDRETAAAQAHQAKMQGFAESAKKKEWLCGDELRTPQEATRCKYLFRSMVPQIQVKQVRTDRKIHAPHEQPFVIENVARLSGGIQAVYWLCHSEEFIEINRESLGPSMGHQLAQLAVSMDICIGCPFWAAKEAKHEAVDRNNQSEAAPILAVAGEVA